MVKPSKPRLIEGPICITCKRALDIREKLKQSEGSWITYVHRDLEEDGFDNDHFTSPIYKIVRE